MKDLRIPPAHNPALRISPLFKDLSELEYNAIAAFLEPRKIQSGETVFKEGEAGEEMFVLVSGRINAWVAQADNTQRLMFEISAGDFFGEMSIIANESRSATLIAKTDTTLVALGARDFYRIIFEHPMIGMKMLKTIGRIQNIWLEQTSRHLGDLMRWGETARRRAISDELTGLYNRRFLEESANERFKTGSMELRNISLLVLDLDHVHKINEEYGTKGGDQVIAAVAEVLRSCTRAGDICARLSGDEFAILLSDTGHEEALGIAEKIRQAMECHKFSVPDVSVGWGKKEIGVNISIGIASAPLHANSWEGLFLVSDAALRSAKESGRNQVRLAGVS